MGGSATTLSLFLTPTVNFSVTAFIWIVGSLQWLVAALATRNKEAIITSWLAKGFYYLVPHFHDFNIMGSIVHPEVPWEVVQAADCDGSTEFIIDTITAAPAGTTWGVGTEINLVNRLNAELLDKYVFCLDPVICPCSTMYRVHPAYVLWSLEHLAQGKVVNQITVDPETARDALVALDRMLAVP